MTLLPPISLDEIDAVVADASGPVLIDLWAPWCGYCTRNMPIVERVASEVAGKASVYGLNVDENPGARDRFGVRTIPSYVLFSGGQWRTIQGSQTRKALLEALNIATD